MVIEQKDKAKNKPDLESLASSGGAGYNPALNNVWRG
jgi:hypothetical protein